MKCTVISDRTRSNGSEKCAMKALFTYQYTCVFNMNDTA